jgi:anti-sigma regulatory factor (Ser/Thr protein kinase)
VVMSFRARVPRELRYRDTVGTMVRAVCRRVEADSGATDVETRVLSAFNEAFNNVAQHAAPADAAGVSGEDALEVDLRVDASALVLEISDAGPGFDFGPSHGAAQPVFETLDDGGMGLFIIRRTMSRVTYQRGAPNRLTMTLDLTHGATPHAPDRGPNDEGTRC